MKNQLINFLLLQLAFTLMLVNPIVGQKKVSIGVVKGKVLAADTKASLIGANITIINNVMGAASDMEGNFIIKNVPVGNYSIRFSYIGYEPLIKTDVIVKSKRITFLSAELKESALEMEGVVITGGYFTEVEQQPTSAINFSSEEIRRAPGSGGDVSRIIMGLPCIAKVDDQTNNLIVRGGSPVENAFFIDNIEIPNINHWPTQGASGGPIGLLNVDFIQDVNFYSGGFSALYGDRLSSIMDITFREGNRNEFDGQLDLNFSGFGGVAEGPLFNKKGSWMLSARRSYLDFLVDMIDLGTTVAPTYGDIQGKLVYAINRNHTLTALGIRGDDHNSPDKETAQENDMMIYGNQDIYENTAGINWRALWNKSGYSNSSIAYTSTKFKEDMYEIGTDIHLLQNRSLEQALKFRNVNHFQLNRKNTIEFGIDIKQLITNYDNFYAKYTDALGDTVPALNIDDRMTSYKFGVFVNYITKPFIRLTTTLGVRMDYFSYNKNYCCSPRFAFSYQVTDLTSISGSTGLFCQSLPLILLSQNEEHKKLKDPVAVHYILGISHLLTENTKFTLEVYQKDYDNFPLDPNQLALFLIDELYYRYGFFFNHEQLVDNGKAYSRGIEIMLQKKLARNFYGLASASYFRTRYKGGDGIWRDRVYDNRIIFNIEGGCKPNKSWEFSARWIYAGGAPYTPYDMEASQTLNRAVLDENRLNQARHPDYHSLNLRFDRRFHFKHTNLIFYFSVWNAYNRKNIASYFWNEIENKPDTIYQWSVLPIFGLEYEF